MSKNNIFDLFKEACKSEAISYKKWDSMEYGIYTVKYFKLNNSNNGLGLCAYIDNFYVYLPNQMLRKINQEDQINELNTKTAIMTFNGRDTKNRPILAFEFVDKTNDSIDGDSDAENVDDDDDDDENILLPPPPPVKKLRKK